MPLTYDWSALNTLVDKMTPTGTTNQTIGLAWGWQTLTDGQPFNGSPIPGRKGLPEISLAHLAFGAFGKIASRQVNEQIASQLWQLGILPDKEIQMVKRDTEMVEVSQNGKVFQLPMDFATKVGLEG